MAELSAKELKVLRVLLENSDRPQKHLAALTGLSESDFSRTKLMLVSRGVIRKFTVDVDYRKLGYPEVGVLFATVIDKKSIRQLVQEIAEIPEAIEIAEAFGQDYDLLIKLMCRDNYHLRDVIEKILSMENIRGGERTYAVIYSRVFKSENGVPVDAVE